MVELEMGFTVYQMGSQGVGATYNWTFALRGLQLFVECLIERSSS